MTNWTPSYPLPFRPVLTRRDVYSRFLTDIRRQYQDLLATLTRSEWQCLCQNSKWTVGEVMVHLYLRMASIPAAVHGIRMGTGYFTMSIFMRDYIRYWYVKTNAGKWTPVTLREAYDAAVQTALATLETIGEEEWWLSAEVWGDSNITLDCLFNSQPDYFAMHLYEIRATLTGS